MRGKRMFRRGREKAPMRPPIYPAVYGHSEEKKMSAALSSTSALLGAVTLAASSAPFGVCTGPGAPANTEPKCLTAVQIPGKPLRSYDISWVNPQRGEYYLADRSNA